MSDILQVARDTLEIEIAGLTGLLGRLGKPFVEAAEMILTCKGKVVVTGMGKSGHIARKIAATFSSTGTQAFFLHPAEASHGYLGIVSGADVVVAISNSGGTEELIRLLGPLRRIGVPLIALTGNADSELARRADVHLDVSVEKEACPLGLTPTASTTAALAMGDALAVSLLKLRGFSAEDYALFHPGGNLGKKLVTKVETIMESGGAVPVVASTLPVREAITELQQKKYGVTAVTDKEGKLAGAFSMGDLTRLHLADASGGFMTRPISAYMSENPKTVTPETLAARALYVMETHKIRALFVTDPERHPIGIIGLYEVLKAIDY